MIPRLRKYASDDKNHQSKQNPSNFARRLFSEVLDEACEKDQQQDIHIYTSGYTKNALPYYNFINMREYCQTSR
ncbi:MAG: hypothetical protein NC433_07200 [Clostridiales bacterium]|nr:hypothetical protein [Clostridiales bacterium]